MMNKLLVAAGLLAAAVSAEPVYEVWGVPASALAWLEIPETVTGTGPLQVVVDDEAVSAQEVVGGGVCAVRVGVQNGTSAATFTRIDAEGRRAPFSRAELESSLLLAPGRCLGVEIVPLR